MSSIAYDHEAQSRAIARYRGKFMVAPVPPPAPTVSEDAPPALNPDPEDWGSPPPDYKTILLQFIASLTLCDHMGDVGDDIATVLKMIGSDIKPDWDDLQTLRQELAKRNITTLHGISISAE